MVGGGAVGRRIGSVGLVLVEFASSSSEKASSSSSEKASSSSSEKALSSSSEKASSTAAARGSAVAALVGSAIDGAGGGGAPGDGHLQGGWEAEERRRWRLKRSGEEEDGRLKRRDGDGVVYREKKKGGRRWVGDEEEWERERVEIKN